jgi:hypothetical protein
MREITFEIIHCETPRCRLQFYEAQPYGVMEQPQKPTRDQYVIIRQIVSKLNVHTPEYYVA